MPRPTNPSTLLSTLLSPLASCHIQLRPHCKGRLGHAPERVTERVVCKVEVGQVPEGCGRNFEHDPEGDTTSVAHEGYFANSGYLKFDSYGLSKISWGTLYQSSESNKDPRG